MLPTKLAPQTPLFYHDSKTLYSAERFILNNAFSNPTAAPRWKLYFILLVFLSLLSTAPALALDEAPSTNAPAAAIEHWRDMKLGLFIHWGPWSQTGKGSIWEITHETDPIKRQAYFDLPKTFNPTRFDPAAWASMAKRAGVKYVVFTTKHHDGFCNFDTATTDFRITNPQFPYHASPNADITAALTRAFRAAGLGVGLYFSNLDWHYPGNGFTDQGRLSPDFPRQSPAAWNDYVQFETNQVHELLGNYGKIDIFWFDIPWPAQAQSDWLPMLRMMRRQQPNVIIDDRGSGPFADFSTYEQAVPAGGVPGPWESNITISEGAGFWYKGPDAQYKSSQQLIRLLADVASKDGNLLLNIGPGPDGAWAPQEQQRLSELGDWLADNGPAIYGTRGSLTDAQPSWGRVTHNGKKTYLIVFDWPKPGEPLELANGLIGGARKVVRASLLKRGTEIAYGTSLDGSTLDLTLPATSPTGAPSVVVLDCE
ncbi:MAG: alpha-L-fucosidase [Tepidisphaeraceae bacterium]|jgi:alpha-L-fucosidase